MTDPEAIGRSHRSGGPSNPFLPSKPIPVLLCLVCALLAPGLASAQGAPPPPLPLDDVEEMDFDRPESWAMAYFATVSLLTGMGTARDLEVGTIELALEGGWIPSLSEDQRRVGFIGDKVEDLNRNSAFGRLRATVGLPYKLSLTLGLSPPIERNGVEAGLLALAIARPVYESSSWRLGLRLFGQSGKIKGDFTCPASIAGLEDPKRNPDACLEPSSDEVRLDYVGLELSATPEIWGPRWQPYVAASANYMDLEFQVKARYSIFVDRNLLLTDGWTYSVAGGVGYQLSGRTRLTGEVFYSPLEVVRRPGQSADTDGLFNVRILLGWKIR
jgi:hypothetical protein